jgi:thiazolinyl imide reductase
VLPILVDDPAFARALRADDRELWRSYRTALGALRRDAGLGTRGRGVRATLVGLVARGSRRSRALAADVGVPMVSSVAEAVEERPDLAIVAVPDGAGGGAMALEFLDRGVAVLQEHPVASARVARCLRAAQRSRCAYEINAHFSDLPLVRGFIREAHRIGRTQAPLSVSIMTSPRCLYSLLDVLRRIFGPLEALRWDVARRGKRRRSRSRRSWLEYETLTGTIRGTPLVLQVQSGTGETDDGNDVLANNRISIWFRDGELCSFDALKGPVIWSRRGARPSRRGNGGATAWDLVYGTAPTFTEGVARRFAANRLAIERILRSARGRQAHADTAPAALIDVAGSYDRLAGILRG